MWTTLTAICLVAVVCGPVWGIARYLRVSLPKYVMPLLAGLTLLSYNVYMGYMRYTWADRLIDAFPKEVVLLKEYRTSSMIEPWTYLVAPVTHFIAADTSKTRVNKEFPDIIMGSTVMVQEHQDTMQMTVLVNCQKQQVAVMPTNRIAEGANPLDMAQWTSGEEFSFMTQFYCK
ncbi:MAG: hypothetical protein HWE34_18300 [Methylocystaceae bacterium]|nr:hypothetical protein [Methylocystaceae bacterium]